MSDVDCMTRSIPVQDLRSCITTAGLGHKLLRKLSNEATFLRWLRLLHPHCCSYVFVSQIQRFGTKQDTDPVNSIPTTAQSWSLWGIGNLKERKVKIWKLVLFIKNKIIGITRRGERTKYSKYQTSQIFIPIKERKEGGFIILQREWLQHLVQFQKWLWWRDYVTAITSKSG